MDAASRGYYLLVNLIRRIPLTRFGWVTVLAIPVLLAIGLITGTGFVAGSALMLALFLLLLGVGPPRNTGRYGSSAYQRLEARGTRSFDDEL